ncbi:hypothetical protein KKG46_01795 [Patescibacteria group bacterium]|nr:hypothetical protein [Patescibacteria group bacterium]
MSEEQKTICNKYKAEYLETPANFKIGISENIKNGLPIHGLRHQQSGDTAGWYIWSGEYSDDPNFFKPLHVQHLKEWCPQVIKYLGLAPGWRFLIDDKGHEDVWFDEKLLKLDK